MPSPVGNFRQEVNIVENNITNLDLHEISSTEIFPNLGGRNTSRIWNSSYTAPGFCKIGFRSSGVRHDRIAFRQPDGVVMLWTEVSLGGFELYVSSSWDVSGQLMWRVQEPLRFQLLMLMTCEVSTGTIDEASGEGVWHNVWLGRGKVGGLNEGLVELKPDIPTWNQPFV